MHSTTCSALELKPERVQESVKEIERESASVNFLEQQDLIANLQLMSGTWKHQKQPYCLQRNVTAF